MQSTENSAASLARPQQGESYEDYVCRAHLALLPSIPEPAERNAAVWGMWEQTNGDAERDRAAQRFSADQFDRRPMVPLFVEHQKVNQAADGSESVTHYNVDELKKIIRENNFRIADTDAYTGLVDRHTVPSGSRDPMPPKTLGYVGPYRLGMLGRKHPRFAIFADEHHRKDRADVLADRPRRSVEVLKLRANGRRYIDPIAALAEAPRLPLPVHSYAADSDETLVAERYSAIAPHAGPYGLVSDVEIDLFEGMAAAIGGDAGGSPGASNTYVPKFSRDKNEATAETEEKDVLNNPNNPDGMVRQVIDALQSTEEWQAITELVAMMKSGQLGGSPEPAAPPEAGIPTGDDPSEVPPMPGDMPPGPMGDMPPSPLGGQPGEEPMPEAMMEREQNVAPALAAAGRMAAGQAAKLAGSQTAKSMAAEIAMDKAMDKLSQPQGDQQQSPMGNALGALANMNTRGTTEAMAGGMGQYGGYQSKYMGNQYMGHHRYSAASRSTDTLSEENEMSTNDVDRYQAIESENVELREQYAAIQAELEAVTQHNKSILTEQAEHYAALQSKVYSLEQDKADAERRERINDLSLRYPVVDSKEECERCLYSAGSEMTQADFEQHCETIERYAAAAAVSTPMIPVGVTAETQHGVEATRYEAAAAAKAVEVVNDHLRRGERISYADALEKAKADL